MTVPARLSVVVPLHGGEEHAEECLESLRDQTLDDMEVILVGRPRGLRPPDHRFTLLTLGDGGDDPGTARNAGAAFATGRYLAFADPGSVVPADAYRALVGALEHTGSDLACGRIRTWTPSQAPAPAAKARLRTHITRHQKLLDDPRAGGTVFRREFWNRHGFAFPPGLGEDFPVTIPAHVLSSSADVLGDVVCLTRGSRPQADPLRRLRAMLEVSDLLGRHAPRLRTAYDLRLAEGPDLEAVLEAVRDRVPDGLAEALGRLDPNAVERLPVLRRLQIHFAARGMIGELAELRTFAASEIRHRGVLRRGLRRRRWYLDYPFRRDPRLPRSLFDATPDLRLVACVDDVRHADGRLALTGHAYIAHLDSGRSRMELWLQRGEERIMLPVRRTRRPDVTADSRQSVACHDDSGFETVIALDVLPAGRWALHARVRARGVTRAGRAIGAPGDRVFDAGNVRVSLTRDRGLTLGPRAADGPQPDPGGHVNTARRTESDGTISAVRWTESGELVLEGAGRCPAGRIVLECGAERHSWPVRQDEATWTAAIGRTADGLPLRSGTWRALTLSSAGRDERVRLSPALIADPPRPRVTGFHEISARTSRDGDLSLAVRPALGPHERGPYATRMRRAAAPRRVTLRNAAVFDSYGGGQYSCNPRAVSEELARRHPDVEIVWVTRDGQFAVPPGVRLVLYGSREHEEALRTSRFVVANRRTQPGWYRKPRGQTVVQTWHGTPLKRLGLDLEGMPYARRVPRDELARQVATWDLLLSPSPFATSALRGAFGYEGEILESGYPRNDVLFDPGRARAARRRLGLPDDRRVILYAPTWRDDETTGRLALDPVRTAGALRDDDVLLVRAHYLVARDLAIPNGDRIRDVSKFPDMADLLAAADVLVTDYSSAMFDFACTGRPMVFFAHDLERYRDQVRGFYFDFEAEAPGPVLRTGDDVLDVLRHGDLGRFAARYERFARRYCPWDDGHASARVVARMRP
ncbi:bifunctional glycosyltransferase family 2 protein/CDP-glycerol:glycerophosphate glycerophosphotransferase [Microbispora sp. NEAU-D428]|uniref:bifunctional glycosyltransferase/CDP-glycerol:glycerophosphate glycerophosphotransferase n=1 Tax=Microbispora sitophila TaxID=2771537 RepID=UPI001865B158|nr:bifunctional glycosyltransferase family 2 protein/CDP-glycerol:glycerophosphate glycerophosphotransferase [Microbispora sitophila]MBE3013764.1 bifunctional glycosyltransferase family 2 protein/CDP-glycerol:glycerophosphate glycerophosphotransferase [Microbispora sitophila]